MRLQADGALGSGDGEGAAGRHHRHSEGEASFSDDSSSGEARLLGASASTVQSATKSGRLLIAAVR